MNALTHRHLDAVFEAYRGTAPEELVGKDRHFNCRESRKATKDWTLEDSRPPEGLNFKLFQNCKIQTGAMARRVNADRHALEPETVLIGYRTPLGRHGTVAKEMAKSDKRKRKRSK